MYEDVQITVVPLRGKVASEVISEHLICKIFLEEQTSMCVFAPPTSNVFCRRCSVWLLGTYEFLMIKALKEEG